MKKACVIIAAVSLLLMFISVMLIVLSDRDIPLGEKIALVRVEGPIVESGGKVKEIKKYAENDSVKAILVRINSPGGAVAPSQEIYDELKKAALIKPVVASMGAIAASGGYYIAAPSKTIIANPGTLTGSIGVIMEIPNFEDLMGKIGIKSRVIKSGKHKDMASTMREMSPEERKILQGVIDDVYEQFVEAVSEGRGLSKETVRKLSDGRIYTGRQALRAGLVDELGNIEYAVKKTAELAGIEGEPSLIEKKEKSGLLELLQGAAPERLRNLASYATVKYLYVP